MLTYLINIHECQLNVYNIQLFLVVILNVSKQILQFSCKFVNKEVKHIKQSTDVGRLIIRLILNIRTEGKEITIFISMFFEKET